MAMQGAPFARPWRAPEPRRWSALELVTWLVLVGAVGAALVALLLALIAMASAPCTGGACGEGIALPAMGFVLAALVALGPLLVLLAGFGRPRPRSEGPAVPRALVVMVWGWLLGPASIWLQPRVPGALPLSRVGLTVTFAVSLAAPFVVARTTSALKELPGRRRPGEAGRRPFVP